MSKKQTSLFKELFLLLPAGVFENFIEMGLSPLKNTKLITTETLPVTIGNCNPKKKLECFHLRKETKRTKTGQLIQ